MVLAAASLPCAAEIKVDLIPSIGTSALVGERVTWIAAAETSEWSSLRYRFRARAAGGDFKVVKDFGADPVLVWAAAEKEGEYEIEAAARDPKTGETAIATAAIRVVSRIDPDNPAVVISPTDHPLVFLYSAPPCAAGERMRVLFTGGDGATVETPPKECDGGKSMNFYLAGLKAEWNYTARHIIEDSAGRVRRSPETTFWTGGIPVLLPSHRVLTGSSADARHGLLLQAPLGWPAVATNLDGEVVWYDESNLSYLTRPEEGGRFWGISENPDAGPEGELIREFDLAGLTVRETNAERINEQLRGMGKREINGFHHEARSLPDGGVLVLAGTGQFLELEEGAGQEYVLSDMILALDEDLQVKWVWDAFDHLDPHRRATLGEKCTNAGGGCPPFHAAETAHDWLHGNSLQLTPDGHILYSSRHQDWLIKIDYADGAGSGEVMWRLGKDGDFTAISGDPSPWFSHQHDGAIVDESGTLLVVFDNGNLRQSEDAGAHSRGQVWRLDEGAMTATLLVNADLGVYSPALGSAQKLEGRTFHFNAGLIPPRFAARGIEVDAAGNTIYSQETAVMLYRSFRMKDLYTRP